MMSGETNVNLLFTSAGRRVELVRAFRRALQSLGLSGRIIALDIDPLAPALQAADQVYIVPRLNSPTYIPTLVEICREARVSVVFPLIDPDIPVLSEHRGAIEATGARVAVVPPHAAAVVSDKWLTTRLFQSLGLRTPRSWLPEQRDDIPHEFPLFIKPRRGSASQHTFKVPDERALSFFLDYVPQPIIQEYLPGPEITSDVICDLDGEVLGVVSRRRIEVRNGEVAKGVTVYEPAIIEGCAAIARALPAVGPITVQCMLKDGVPYFTEVNARFGGGVPLGIAAGVDAPRWLLARVAGLELDLPSLGAYQTGLYLTRFDDTFFITEAQHEQIGSRRL
jgi:carbamoyl-phosphate synthase large subunit